VYAARLAERLGEQRMRRFARSAAGVYALLWTAAALLIIVIMVAPRPTVGRGFAPVAIVFLLVPALLALAAIALVILCLPALLVRPLRRFRAVAESNWAAALAATRS
jgi:hypothetical protein